MAPDLHEHPHALMSRTASRRSVMLRHTLPGLAAVAVFAGLSAPAFGQGRGSIDTGRPTAGYYAPRVWTIPGFGVGTRYESTVPANPIFMTSINHPRIYGSYTYGLSGSFYPSAQYDYIDQPMNVASADLSATLRIRAPEDAVVFVNGERLGRAGEVRTFVTPQ